MKKITALVLVVMLLCSCAFAEESKPFTFAGGAHFGMSIYDMLSLEGTDYSRYYTVGTLLEEFDYSEKQVSRYTATRGYLFAEEELVMLGYYNFSENEIKDYKYLKTALNSVYGKSTDVSADEINNYMALLGVEEKMDLPICSEWKVDGEAKIWLFMNMEAGIYLFYISDDFDPSMVTEIDTTNL